MGFSYTGIYVDRFFDYTETTRVSNKSNALWWRNVQN
jgi:hypothetical protein